jgi:OmpR-family two-component system manganese-sensing response regulator
MNILLVDDETELTDPLSRVLAREGYKVDTAYDGTNGRLLAKTGNYDLLILDWMLPGKTGLEICQELRGQGVSTPVLFLTAKDTLDDRVEGLDAGADDYLVKPFELRELLARVRALLRRSTSQARGNQINRLIVGDLELDCVNCRKKKANYCNTLCKTLASCSLTRRLCTLCGKMASNPAVTLLLH